MGKSYVPSSAALSTNATVADCRALDAVQLSGR
jgi:hypothetical protein